MAGYENESAMRGLMMSPEEAEQDRQYDLQNPEDRLELESEMRRGGNGMQRAALEEHYARMYGGAAPYADQQRTAAPRTIRWNDGTTTSVDGSPVQPQEGVGAASRKIQWAVPTNPTTGEEYTKRGVVPEFFRAVVGGGASTLPKMINQGLQAVSPAGSDTEAFFRANTDYWKEAEKGWAPDMAGHGRVARGVIEAGQQLAPSVAGMVGMAINPIAGAAGIVALYGGSTFTDTYDRAIAKGITPDEAFQAAIRTGGIEAFGEIIGDYMGGKFLKGGAEFIRNMFGEKGLSTALQMAKDPKWAAKFAGAWAGNTAVQSGTEYGQEYGQSVVENEYGVSQSDPHKRGMHGAEIGMYMSGLMGPFGGVGARRAGQQREAAGAALDDVTTPIDVRKLALEQVSRSAESYGAKPEELAPWKEAQQDRFIQDADAARMGESGGVVDGLDTQFETSPYPPPLTDEEGMRMAEELAAQYDRPGSQPPLPAAETAPMVEQVAEPEPVPRTDPITVGESVVYQGEPMVVTRVGKDGFIIAKAPGSKQAVSAPADVFVREPLPPPVVEEPPPAPPPTPVGPARLTSAPAVGDVVGHKGENATVVKLNGKYATLDTPTGKSVVPQRELHEPTTIQDADRSTQDANSQTVLTGDVEGTTQTSGSVDTQATNVAGRKGAKGTAPAGNATTGRGAKTKAAKDLGIHSTEALRDPSMPDESLENALERMLNDATNTLRSKGKDRSGLGWGRANIKGRHRGGAAFTPEQVKIVADEMRQRGGKGAKGPYARLFTMLKEWNDSVFNFSRARSETKQAEHFYKLKNSTHGAEGSVDAVVPMLHVMEQEFGTDNMNKIIHALKSYGERPGISEGNSHVRLAAAWNMFKHQDTTNNQKANTTIRGNWSEELLNDKLREQGVEIDTKMAERVKAHGLLKFMEDTQWQGFSADIQVLARMLTPMLKTLNAAGKLPTLEIRNSDHPDGGGTHGEFFLSKDNKGHIVLYRNGNNARTLVHELLHAVTTHKIYFEPKHPAVVELRKTLAELARVHTTAVSDHMSNAKLDATDTSRLALATRVIINEFNYAVGLEKTAKTAKQKAEAHGAMARAISEFVTYGLTDKQFQNYMHSIRLTGKEGLAAHVALDIEEKTATTASGAPKGRPKTALSIWSKFVNAMSWLTGGKAWNAGNMTMMGQFLSDSSRLLAASDAAPMPMTDVGAGSSTADFRLLSEGIQKVKGGANVARLAQMLGPQLYGDMKSMASTSIKEVFQNSFDAVKDMIAENPDHAGEIRVTTDQATRTINITDNGRGMTPEIITKAFLTLAGTHKEGDRSSGGFGIAKMQFLFGNKSMKLVTVRDGVKSTMETTGLDLMKSMDENADVSDGIDLRTEKTNAPNGTNLTIEIPDSYFDPSTGEKKNIDFPAGWNTPESLVKSPLLEPITVVYNGDTLPIGKNFPKDDYTTFANVKFDWGTASIIVGKKENKGVSSSNVQVLSNGLSQFGLKISKDPADQWSGPVPRQFYFNVHPTVRPEDPGYPFELSRQKFSAMVQGDFTNIMNYLNMLYRGNQTAEVSKGYGDIRYVDAKGKMTATESLAPKLEDDNNNTIRIREGDDIEIKDGRMVVNGREVPTLTPEDLKKGRVDLAKFKIDQSAIRTDLPVVHSNVAVTAAPAVDYGALLDAARAKAREASDAYFNYDGSEDGWKSADGLRAAYEAAQKELDAVHKASDDAYDNPKPVVAVPLVDAAADEFGPAFGKFNYALGKVFTDIRDWLNDNGGPSMRDIGTMAAGVGYLQPPTRNERVFGVHHTVPYRGMLVDPAALDMDDPRAQALHLYNTMVHESAHYAEMNHNASFWATDNELRMKLELADMDVAFKKRLLKLVTNSSDILNYLRSRASETTSQNIGKQLSGGYHAAMAADQSAQQGEDQAGYGYGAGVDAEASATRATYGDGGSNQQGAGAAQKGQRSTGVSNSRGEGGPVITLQSLGLPQTGTNLDPATLPRVMPSSHARVDSLMKPLFEAVGWGKVAGTINSKLTNTAAAIHRAFPGVAKWVQYLDHTFGLPQSLADGWKRVELQSQFPMIMANEVANMLENMPAEKQQHAMDYMDGMKSAEAHLTADEKVVLTDFANTFRDMVLAYNASTTTQPSKKTFKNAKQAAQAAQREQKQRGAMEKNIQQASLSDLLVYIADPKEARGRSMSTHAIRNYMAADKSSIENDLIVNGSVQGGKYYAAYELRGNQEFLAGMWHHTKVDGFVPSATLRLDQRNSWFMGRSDSKTTTEFTRNKRPSTGSAATHAMAIRNTVDHMDRVLSSARYAQQVVDHGIDAGLVYADKDALMAAQPHLEKSTIYTSAEYPRQSSAIKAMLRRSDQWIYVPETDQRYGAMAGHYVNGSVWAALDDIHHNQPLINSSAFNFAMRIFKKAKTIYSPGTHVVNVGTNVGWMYLHDIPPAAVGFAMQTYWTAKTNPSALTPEQRAVWRAFQQSGALVADYSTAELRGGLSEVAMSTLNTKASGLSGLIGAMTSYEAKKGERMKELVQKGAAYAGKADKLAQEVYSAEDNIFRLAAFTSKLASLEAASGRKFTADEQFKAAKAAAEEFLDYSIHARGVNIAKQSVLPFISWPYRAVPALMKIAINKPWKLAGIVGAYALLDMLVVGLTGGDGEDERKRKRLPSYMNDRLFGFGPRMYLQIPGMGTDAAPTYFKVGSFIPGGDVGRGNDRNGFMGQSWIPSAVSPNGPFISAIAGAVLGVDPFTGMPISKSTDSQWEAFNKRAKFLVGQMVTPPALDPKRAGEAWDRIVNDKHGPLGAEYDKTIEVGKLLGLRFVQVNMREASMKQEKAIKAITNEYKKEMAAITKEAAQFHGYPADKLKERKAALMERLSKRIADVRNEDY